MSERRPESVGARREIAGIPGEYELIPIEELLNSGVLRVQRVGADGELWDVAVWENLVQ